MTKHSNAMKKKDWKKTWIKLRQRNCADDNNGDIFIIDVWKKEKKNCSYFMGVHRFAIIVDEPIGCYNYITFSQFKSRYAMLRCGLCSFLFLLWIFFMSQIYDSVACRRNNRYVYYSHIFLTNCIEYHQAYSFCVTIFLIIFVPRLT